MLDHIGVDVSDLARSRVFYEAALTPLGYRVIQDLTAEQTGANAIVMFGVEHAGVRDRRGQGSRIGATISPFARRPVRPSMPFMRRR